MPAILVFGASGAVGQFLLPRLIERGSDVVAISRQSMPQHLGVTWMNGDLFGDVVLPADVDTIFCLGPLDAFAAWFARVCPRVRRVVALSSMSAESKRESIDAQERALAARLQTGEEILMRSAKAQNAACTIFRPTLIYGSGRDRSLAPIARFAQRWRVLPIPRGADGLRQPVHADDLAQACIAVVAEESTFGNVYELGGGERLRFDVLLARIVAGPPRLALAMPLPLVLVRYGAQLVHAPNTGPGALARLREPLIADNTAATRDFGYAPRAFIVRDVLGRRA